MGVFTYIIGLIPSVLVAMIIRAVIHWLTAKWRPMTALSWQNILRAVLRAFPFAFAFAPILLMKRGLGVLVPSSVYLCASLYESLFGARPRDSEDIRNTNLALMTLLLVWGVLAFIFFAIQTSAIDKRIRHDSGA